MFCWIDKQALLTAEYIFYSINKQAFCDSWVCLTWKIYSKLISAKSAFTVAHESTVFWQLNMSYWDK